MRRIVCALALMLLTPVPDAAAQDVAAQESATPAEHFIAEAGAQDLFEALPSAEKIVIRHRRSGLTCRLDATWRNRIIVFPQAARGEDIACDSTDGDRTETLYATRYSFATTLSEQFNGAVDAIRRRFPDARPYAAAATDVFPGLPPSLSGAFLVTRPADHAPMYTQINVAMSRNWVFVMRYTALAADSASEARAAADARSAWSSALAEIAADRL